MIKKTVLPLMYIAIFIFLTFTTFITLTGTEYILPDIFMAILTGAIYIVFTIGWAMLVPHTKLKGLHKGLFMMVTWFLLLTLGDILFLQETPNILIMSGILLSQLLCLYLYRANKMLVDAFTAAALFVALYIAMQFEHAIIPGGVIGGAAISLLFLVIAAKKSLQVTKILGRFVFFSLALIVLIFSPVTPILAEDGYLLYLIILIFVVAFIYRRKLEVLLPQQLMPALLVATFVIYIVKLF